MMELTRQISGLGFELTSRAYVGIILYMDNQDFNDYVAKIAKMDLAGLKREKRSLEAQNADPYPDDDMAGDIAVTMWLSLVKARINALNEKKREVKKGVCE
jgi:hypothetical protein